MMVFYAVITNLEGDVRESINNVIGRVKRTFEL